MLPQPVCEGGRAERKGRLVPWCLHNIVDRLFTSLFSYCLLILCSLSLTHYSPISLHKPTKYVCVVAREILFTYSPIPVGLSHTHSLWLIVKAESVNSFSRLFIATLWPFTFSLARSLANSFISISSFYCLAFREDATRFSLPQRLSSSPSSHS